MSQFLYPLIGSAVGAPLGLWIHAAVTAKVQLIRWNRILAAYNIDGEGD